MKTRTTTSTTKKGGQKKIAALALVAAGSSQRMEGLGKKEYLPLNGGTVLSEAALPFLKTGRFCIVAVVHPKNEKEAAQAAFYKNPLVKELLGETAVLFVPGGASRQESVLNALKAIRREQKAADKKRPRGKEAAKGQKALQGQEAAAGDNGERGKNISQAHEAPRVVLIHDGARPFISRALVQRTLSAALKYGAAVPALEPVETQKELDAKKRIARHLERSSLAAVQTPQGFLFPEILGFHTAANKGARKAAGKESAGGGTRAPAVTDDTEIWDRYSAKKTRVIKGEAQNIKITYPGDAPKSAASREEKTFRVGLGTDLHRLVFGRPLVLGGIRIPFQKGEAGHSDGDALLHAITDSLLGAAALGDIGSYFPSDDPKWKGADSKKLLKAAWRDVRRAGWRLENLDCAVHLQEPKFLPHREAVRQSIADVLGVQKERVFVKAKTGERVGLVGSGEVVEARAVCLLSKN